MIEVFSAHAPLSDNIRRWYIDEDRPHVTIKVEKREREIMQWLEGNCPTAVVELRFVLARIYVDTDAQAVAVKLRFG